MEYPTLSTAGTTNDTTTTTALSADEGDPQDKAFIDEYFLYLVIGVPCVVILGVVGGVAFVLFWRNRSATRRKRHWDMQKMYSGVSMVDYDIT
jgi:hypothetical protein